MSIISVYMYKCRDKGKKCCWLILVTHINESFHIYEWVMSHIWMRHITHVNATCRTYQWVMSHICHTHTDTHCNTLQHTATYCNTHCNTGAWAGSVTSECHKHLPTSTRLSFQDQRGASHCNTLQHTLQHTPQHTLQHTATHTATHNATSQTCSDLNVARTARRKRRKERKRRKRRKRVSKWSVSHCVWLPVVVCDYTSMSQTHYNTLQWLTIQCNWLHLAATHQNTFRLQRAPHFRPKRCVAVCCSVL